MGAIALRNLAERKPRTVLTALAIVLGVMMVSGTYVLTDTIDDSFDQIFTESNEGIDAVVTTQGGGRDRRRLGAAVPRVGPRSRSQAVDGVGEAAGGIADQQVSIIGADGEPRGGNGAPSFGFSVVPERFDPLTYVEGGPPQADDEVVDRQGLRRRRGLRGRRQGRDRRQARPPRSTRWSAIATLGDVDSFGGATIAELTLPEAQRITGKEGEFDQIDVAAAPTGPRPEQLAANLERRAAGLGRGRDRRRERRSPSATTSASSSAS